MPAAYPSRKDDERLLGILHLKDVVGLTCLQIAERTSGTRSSVAGHIGRVKRDKTPCECTKPENIDGGMKPLWWRK